jgi:hypothetical protein
VCRDEFTLQPTRCKVSSRGLPTQEETVHAFIAKMTLHTVKGVYALIEPSSLTSTALP